MTLADPITSTNNVPIAAYRTLGAGNDFFSGTNNNDQIRGGGGRDHLSGSFGSDRLLGEGGDDSLDGGYGFDILIGGAGSDEYRIGLGRGDDEIDDREGGASDTIYLYGGGQITHASQIRLCREGNDATVFVYDSSNSERIITSFSIKGMGSDSGQVETLIVLEADEETPAFPPINLVALYRGSGRTSRTPDLGVGGGDIQGDEDEEDIAGDFPSSAEFTWTGNSSANEIQGYDDQDVIAGLGGGDDIVGRDGDDWLFGNDGDDYLNGGNDDDVLIDDDEGDLNQDTLFGDDGDDILVFRGSGEGEIDRGDGAAGDDIAIIDLSDRSEDWRLTQYNDDPRIRPGDSNDGGEIRLERVETLALFFGSGEDDANGGSEVDYIRGGDGDDELSGGANDDILYGEDDNDTIEGGSGEDWLDGGDGTDLAILDLGGDTENMVFIAGHAGDETGLLLADGTYLRNFERFHLTFGSGDDQIWLGTLGDEVYAGSGDDVISSSGRGRNVIHGNAGVDRVELDFSWAGDEVNYGSQSGDRTFYVGSRYADAVDRVRIGSVEQYAVVGGQFDDNLYGGDASDELFGGQGHDRLNGNDGDDYLSGGSGDDLIRFGTGVDWADGGSGHNTGDLLRSASNLDFVFDHRLAASDAGVTLADGTFMRSIEAWESLSFGSGDDVVRLTVGTTERSDVQLGGGFNHLIIDHEGQSDVLTTHTGVFNTVPSYLGYRGPNQTDNDIGLWAVSVDVVTVRGGSAADSLGGLDGADVLNGNGGDDVLIGNGGDDTLDGGQGVDSLDGGDGDDVLRGGDGHDVLTGWQGNDVLYGDAGDDTIRGDSNITQGSDQVYGGSGDDFLIGGQQDDLVDGGAGYDMAEFAGDVGQYTWTRLPGGRWIVSGPDGDDIVVDVELLRFNNATVSLIDGSVSGPGGPVHVVGTGADNTLSGSTGADTLVGLAGSDTLNGEGGDDTLVGGAGSDALSGGLGLDTADYGLAASAVTARLDTGRATNDGDGASDTLTGMENLTGSAFDDTLFGSVGANVLRGGLGRDTLLGLAGDDVLHGGEGVANTLYGGLGNDRYVISAADSCVENANEGVDTIETATLTVYNLGANVENLTYTGAGSFTAGGNVLVNVLTGGTGADVLRGRGGNDTLAGGEGLDTADYSLAAAGVTVQLNANRATNDGDGGSDVFTSIENATGSAFNDVIFGSAGANELRGGLGADTLVGYAGNDVLAGGSGAANQLQGGLGDDVYIVDALDTVVELAGEGTDTVRTNVANFALRVNVENLTYTGPSNFAGTGNASDNVITGGALNDTLSGLGGNDTLIGGVGMDHVLLSGVRANYVFAAVDGGYRVTDNVAGRDGVDLLLGVERVRFSDGQVLVLATLPAAAALPSSKAEAGDAWVLPALDEEGPLVRPGLADKAADEVEPLVQPGVEAGKSAGVARWLADDPLVIQGPHGPMVMLPEDAGRDGWLF